MEQRNREEIIQIKGDISHIKITTEDIKTGVAALVARAEQNGKEIVDLRGRVREAEHDIIAIKSDIKTLKADIRHSPHTLTQMQCQPHRAMRNINLISTA